MNKEYTFSLTLLFLLAAFHITWGQPVGAEASSGKPAANQPPARLRIKIKVVDIDEGNPLEKVYVTAGIKSGYTNKQGLLELDSVMAESQVVASYTGYIEQAKRAKAQMTFRLLKTEPNDQGDNNSIHTGLYIRPVEHFAGAANVISGERLRRLNPVSLLDALALTDPAFQVWHTNLSGDDPNQLPEVQLRGANHFPASASIATNRATSSAGVQVTPSDMDYIAQQVINPNQPLVLLDGVQVSLHQLTDIDIFSIEKLTILKDAAATAAYGSRAANGVFLVQTSIPARGVLNVRYSGQLQISKPNVSSYNLMGAAEKLELEKKAGMYANNDALYQQRLQAVNNGVNTNWLDVPTHSGIGSRHSLMVDGGDDVIRYGLDFGFNKMAGGMVGSRRNNMNIGGYLSARIKNFSIRNHISYNETTGQHSNFGSLHEYALLNPYWRATDSISGGVPKILEEYTLQTPNGDSVVRFYNPAYNSTLASLNKSTYSRFSDLLQLSLVLGRGLTLDGRVLLTTTSDVSDRFLPPSHTEFAKATPDQFFKRGLYAQTSRGFAAAEGGLVLNYHKHKGLHYTYASAGVNMMSTQSEASGLLVQGFTSDQIANVAFGSGYANTAPAAGKINTRLISSFVNAAYSYDNRYQLDATFNRDGASEFGDNARYAHYFTGAASWNLHNEPFFKANRLLNQLRIRMSAGRVGSRFFQEYLGNTGYDYFTNQQYILGGSNLSTRGIGLGNYLVGVGNQNLQSPAVTKMNIATDAVLLKNRLFVRVEWYKEISRKLVLPVYSPASTGFSNFSWYQNLGGIENQGFEFSASYFLINNTKKGFLWNLGFNVIHRKNEIKATSSYIDELNKFNNSASADQTKPQPNYVAGQSLTAIWAVPSLGIDPATGKEKFLKADGTETFEWNAVDKIVAGDLASKWQGNFGSNITIKKWSVGAWFSWQLGAQYYNQTLADKLENADLTYNVDQRAAGNRWQQPGDNALYKPLSLNGLATAPTYATSRFVEDAHFISYSSISVKYTWPSFKIAKLPFQNTSIGFVANSSFRQGFNHAERGIQYPFARFYSFTISTSIQ